MTTANTIIAAALAKLGVIGATDTVTGDDAMHCLGVLNTMVDQWALQNLVAYTNTDASATLGAGIGSLTIGPSMQLNVARPVRIEVGSYATSGGKDWPLSPLSEQQWNDIFDKAVTAHVPYYYWYDAGASTGTVYYWPKPQASVVVHHPVQQQLAQFATLTTDYALPQGYTHALAYNLALELAPDYERMPTPPIAAAARNSLRLLKRSNVSVPELEVDVSPRDVRAFADGWS